MEPGHGLGMSMILRPHLEAEREGWLYTACLLAVLDAMDDRDLALEWPDRIVRDRATAAAIGIQDDTTTGRVGWAVTSVLVPGAEPPRGDLLARMVDTIDTRLGQDPSVVLDDYRQRCATLGRRVRARLLPLGSAGPVVDGVAVDVTEDGGMTILTDEDRRVVVLPHALGFVEDPDAAPPGPDRG
jgi:BirA family transcriptional regulator, biotin operon repressor / biotin---[acetyl-CoA-carboxylase] ligase